MILRRRPRGNHPITFRAMTGRTVAAFDRMSPELLDAFRADRCRRPGRQRTLGGDDRDLHSADRFLLTIGWLRHYPTAEVLGYLSGIVPRRPLTRDMTDSDRPGR